MRLVTVSGSLRRGSYNRMLLDAAARELPRGVGSEPLRDLRELPHYSEDADVEPAPPSVARLRAALGAANAVLISTPEYNTSLPGALKDALDWPRAPIPTTACGRSPSR